jgi:hypothetical protein
MSQNDTSTEHGEYKTPTWVKALGVIAVLAIILIGIMLLSGEHGPGRHMPSATATDISVESTESSEQ